MGVMCAPTTLNSFFKKKYFDLDFSRISLFIIRNDGVMLHSISDKTNDEVASIGALLAGLWQAAEALSNYIPNRQNDNGFRLAFDSISEGIYLLPLEIHESTYYLCSIFHGVMNPGQLKSKIRSLVFELSEFMEKSNVISHGVRKEFLFNDITSEEMDQLFAFAEN